MTSGDSKLSLLRLFADNFGWEKTSGNVHPHPPEIVCDAVDVEFNIVHLTKLLRCFLVVGFRLAIELDLVVAVFPLALININREQERARISHARAVL